MNFQQIYARRQRSAERGPARQSFTAFTFPFNTFQTHFRFEQVDIDQLRRKLQIPDEFVTSTGLHLAGEEALLILLRRLAYPKRLLDLALVLPLTATQISHFF